MSAEVKEEADMNPDFENVAVEFNIESFSPTYRLIWGSQGASNALAVAQRLGFDRAVLESAREWLKKLQAESDLKGRSETMTDEVLVQPCLSI
jgi:dsDNA-specific endonuclease/ATPase MutS2